MRSGEERSDEAPRILRDKTRQRHGQLLLWRLASLLGAPYLFSNVVNTLLLRSDNYFSGSLPDAISQAPNLDVLDVRLNLLGGSLPDSFASQGIRTIDVSSNQFSGSVPPAWSTLTSVTSLDLSDNLLNGTFDSGEDVRGTNGVSSEATS